MPCIGKEYATELFSGIRHIAVNIVPQNKMFKARLHRKMRRAEMDRRYLALVLAGSGFCNISLIDGLTDKEDSE